MQATKNREQGLEWILRQVWLGCFSLPVAVLLALTIQSRAFSQLSAELGETCSTVVWYVKGGHWREDVQIYLAHAEYVFFPATNTGARISLAEKTNSPQGPFTTACARSTP